jgi:prolyl-tRNA synthetase
MMKEGDSSEIIAYCHKIKEELEKLSYFGRDLSVLVDERDLRAGEKSWDAIKKGYPVRIEIGAREMKEGKIPVFKRTKEKKESILVERDELSSKISSILDDVHVELYTRALEHQKANTTTVSTLNEFKKFFGNESSASAFVIAPFKGDKALEAEIQKEFGVTIRCIPHHLPPSENPCIFTNQSGAKQVIFAKSY